MYVFGALVNGLIIVPAIIPAIIVVYTMVYIIEAIEMRLDLSEAIKES